MAFLTNRRDFINYCLRQLGAPVIDINVAEEQVDDRIDDALQKFWEFHADGLEKQFLIYLLTEEDIDTKSIPIADNITSILRILPTNTTASSESIDYQVTMTEILNMQKPGSGIGSFVITQSYLSLMNQYFNYEKPISFNRYTNLLRIETDWSKFNIGDPLAIECYMITDPDVHMEVWNDMWLKQYATALIKKQWGQNLIKYEGFQLPSGTTLNGRQFYDDANVEIEKLETELRDTWELPLDFFTG